MLSQHDIQQLHWELSKLTAFIADFGTDDELHSGVCVHACNVSDALAWVLEEIQTDHFKSDAHLNLHLLRGIVKLLEIRSGKKLADYQ